MRNRKKPIGYILMHDSPMKKEMEDIKRKNFELFQDLSKTFSRDKMELTSFDIFIKRKKRWSKLAISIIKSTYEADCDIAKQFKKKIGKSYKYIGSEDLSHIFEINESNRHLIEELQKRGFKKNEV